MKIPILSKIATLLSSRLSTPNLSNKSIIPDTEFEVQYPVYLIDNSEVLIERTSREKGLESWMMCADNTTDETWQMRAFDSNYTFLSLYEQPWSGGAFEFYIDSNIDHDHDKRNMRTLLIQNLISWDIIPDEGTVEGWSMDRLLSTALHRRMS